MPTPPPFDVTIAVALAPYVALALLALASPILAYAAVRHRRAARALYMTLACEGAASPTGCAFGTGPRSCDPRGACRFDLGRATDPPTAAEDALTYALQAEGPDEMPEGYYRALARVQLADEHRAAAAEGDPSGRPCAFRQPDGACDLAGRCACRDAVNLLDHDDTEEPAESATITGTFRLNATTFTGEPLTGTATITPVGDVSDAAVAAVVGDIDAALAANRVAVTPPWAQASAHPMHDQTARLAVSDTPAYATDRTTINVPPYLRDPDPAPDPAPEPEPAQDARGYAPETWPENARPTAEDWAAWFVACSPPAQVEIAEKVLADNQTAHDCFLRNHATIVADWPRVVGDHGRLLDRLAQEENAATNAAEQNLDLRAKVHDLMADLADAAEWRARAEAAEHDLTQTRATLDRARGNLRRTHDALRACEAAYAAAQDEWKGIVRDLREARYAAEDKAERILANVAADGASDRLIECARADEHLIDHLARTDPDGAWRDLDTPFQRARYLTGQHTELRVALAEMKPDPDAFRAAVGAPSREEADAILAEREEAAALAAAMPPHEHEWVDDMTVLLTSHPPRVRVTCACGEVSSRPTKEPDARGSEALHEHRAAQNRVADARRDADLDGLTNDVHHARDLPPAPEPIGTADEWLAVLEEWHDADQREAAEVATVETSRGLTYTCKNGWHRHGEATVTRACSGYADHDTIAATAAGA